MVSVLVPNMFGILRVHVGETPVESEDKVVVLRIFRAEAQADSAVEALVMADAVFLCEDAFGVVLAVVVVFCAEVSVRPHGEVGAEVGIDAHALVDVVAVSHVDGDGKVARAGDIGAVCAAHVLEWPVNSAAPALHAVFEPGIDEQSADCRQHIFGAYAQVQARFGVEFKAWLVLVLHIADVHAEKSHETEVFSSNCGFCAAAVAAIATMPMRVARIFFIVMVFFSVDVVVASFSAPV